mgnify:FL=1|jgi:hypothetical protein
MVCRQNHLDAKLNPDLWAMDNNNWVIFFVLFQQDGNI